MAEEPPPNLLNVENDEIYDQFEEGEHHIEDNLKETQPPELNLEHNTQPEDCDVEEEVLSHDDMIEVEPPQLQAQPPTDQGAVVRRVIRRVRMDPSVSDPVEGSSNAVVSNNHGMIAASSSRRVYIRRKRTPEEELALERYEQEMQQQPPGHRIPAAPGKRGRRPLMLSHADTEPVSRTEAARRTGRPVVIHPSGVEFAIPVSLEAHPVQLSDTIPDNPSFDILKDSEGLPYCSLCHCVVRTFNALEYHMMSVHLKYRPYRCMYCVKEHFFTEEECIAHLKSTHTGKPLSVIREVKEDKEAQLVKFFQSIFIMIREGEELNEERVQGMQQAAYHQMQKYHRMRFKVPEVVARQRSQKDASAQTFVTMAAPQTMVTMPMKSPFAMRSRNDMLGQVKMVRLPNGEYAHVIQQEDRYVVDRDMEMGDGSEYDHDQIDVVDAEEHLVHHGHY